MIQNVCWKNNIENSLASANDERAIGFAKILNKII